MKVARYVFWGVVFFWWALDFYVLALRKNGYHKIIERKSKYIIIGLILTGVLLAVAPESFRTTWRNRDFGVMQLIGTAVLSIGVMVRFTAIRTLGKHFTPDIGVVEHEKKLITRGLYSKIRHPSYTGEIIAFLGLAIAFQHFPSSFFIFAFPTIAFIFRAIVEEKKLLEELGEIYLEYRKRTRMFI